MATKKKGAANAAPNAEQQAAATSDGPLPGGDPAAPVGSDAAQGQPAAPAKVPEKVRVMARTEGSYYSQRVRAGEIFYLRHGDKVPEWCLSIAQARKERLLGGRPDSRGVMRPLDASVMAGQSPKAVRALQEQARREQERRAAAQEQELANTEGLGAGNAGDDQ